MQSKANLFQKTEVNLDKESTSTNPNTLKKAALHALKYFFKSNDPVLQGLTKSKMLEELISSEETMETLKYILKAENEELTNPNFLENNFTFIKWNGDEKEAKKRKVNIDTNTIRLTHYAVFSCKGSYEKSEECPCALYHITKKEVKAPKYTKQEVLLGAVNEHKDIKPMVWVPRQGLEDALLQGSIVVTIQNREEKLFNVDKNNGIPYDQANKNPFKQKRYWYFKEIGQTRSQGNIQHLSLVSLKSTACAGDVKNMGLGKVILLRYTNEKTKKKEFLIVVLADKGGAFENNLYQLDLFEGIFATKDTFFSQVGK